MMTKKAISNKILNRLRDVLPKKYRKEIKKKLYGIENNEALSEEEKEENDEYLRNLVRILNNKEKYHPYDRDDLGYYGSKHIENLFGRADKKDYYKPILVKSSFKGKYKYYENRQDRKNNYR